jgi:hypothetical protein
MDLNLPDGKKYEIVERPPTITDRLYELVSKSGLVGVAFAVTAAALAYVSAQATRQSQPVMGFGVACLILAMFLVVLGTNKWNASHQQTRDEATQPGDVPGESGTTRSVTRQD